MMASSKTSWQKVANLGKAKYGLRWGGDFSGGWDKVHFDYGNKYSIQQLKALYEMNELVNKKYVKTF